MRSAFLGLLCLLITATGLAGGAALAATDPGSLDSTFVTGTGFTEPSGAFVNDIALQPDGKILVGGSFTAYNGTPRNNLVRLNPDGSLDSTLQQAAGGFDAPVADIDVLPDGDLLVAGRFSQYGPTTIRAIARLNPDGTIDPSFAPGSSIENGVTPSSTTVYDALQQPDGKVVAVGEFTKYGVQPRPRILRLTSTGDLDYTFFPGTGLTGGVPEQVSRNADGTLLVAGLFTHYDGVAANGAVLVSPDGTRNGGFSAANTTSGIYTTVSSADGSVMIGGQFVLDSAFQSLARLQSTGATAPGFTSGLDWDYVFGIGRQTDGKLVVGGRKSAGPPVGRLARVNADGSIDTTFNVGAQPDANVTEIVIQSDNKILVGGAFATIGGQPAGGIARVLSGLEPSPAPPATSDPTTAPIGPAPDASAPASPAPSVPPTASPPAPVAAPGKVRSVRVSKRGKRTIVRWRSPQNSTVTGYRTRISKPDKATYRPWTQVTTTRKEYRGLAKGRYRLQVLALNPTGTGPVTTTSFRVAASKRG